MKNFSAQSLARLFSPAFAPTAWSLLLAAVLGFGLWIATSPAARARILSPAEMILEGLPPGKTMKSASKPEFLSAVCAAVRRHREMAPEITKVAVSAHHEYAGDIVATVLRCSPSADCDFVGSIVGAAVRAAPGDASAIDDAALAVVPDCADAIQQATASAAGDIPAEGPAGEFGGAQPTGQVPLPGSIGGGGGGFNPEQQLILVCDNGTQRSVAENALGAFLSSHPGSFVGNCQPTPTTNR